MKNLKLNTKCIFILFAVFFLLAFVFENRVMFEQASRKHVYIMLTPLNPIFM